MVRFDRAEHKGQTEKLLTCEKVDRCAWSAICGCVAVHARICLDVE
jgi:DNA primase